MLRYATDQNILDAGPVSLLAGTFVSLNRHRFNAARVDQLRTRIQNLFGAIDADDAATIAGLQHNLVDPSSTVRAVAAAALITAQGTAAFPALFAALRQIQAQGEDPQSLVAAIVKFVQSNSSDCLTVLTRMSCAGSANDLTLRIDAIWALSYLPASAVEPVLLPLLKDSHADVRTIAANSLRHAPSAYAIAVMADCFAHESSVECRIAMVTALQHSQLLVAQTALQLARHDADARVRSLCPPESRSLRAWVAARISPQKHPVQNPAVQA